MSTPNREERKIEAIDQTQSQKVTAVFYEPILVGCQNMQPFSGRSAAREGQEKTAQKTADLVGGFGRA